MSLSSSSSGVFFIFYLNHEVPQSELESYSEIRRSLFLSLRRVVKFG